MTMMMDLQAHHLTSESEPAEVGLDMLNNTSGIPALTPDLSRLVALAETTTTSSTTTPTSAPDTSTEPEPAPTPSSVTPLSTSIAESNNPIITYSETREGSQHIFQIPSSYNSESGDGILRITFDDCKTGC